MEVCTLEMSAHQDSCSIIKIRLRKQNISEKYGKQSLLIAYTRTPVTTEAMNVPRIAKVTIAPKFAKNGFCKPIKRFQKVA